MQEFHQTSEDTMSFNKINNVKIGELVEHNKKCYDHGKAFFAMPFASSNEQTWQES